jgi:hypothetical protein
LGKRELSEEFPGAVVWANSFPFRREDNAIAPIPSPLSLKKCRRVTSRRLSSQFLEVSIYYPFNLSAKSFDNEAGIPMKRLSNHPRHSEVIGQGIFD